MEPVMFSNAHPTDNCNEEEQRHAEQALEKFTRRIHGIMKQMERDLGEHCSK